ncbi:hypothetical protein PR048_008598 [Dryococelus australis]|uniref:DDE Tnp4 domain-containing protein n=1 Tax=Dryococelus australis TaxID=614101 RepID=A0ABQ9HYE1_9NEOP|nr:hypothetical protein PR048_008598 [Dryococelus australis]
MHHCIKRTHGSGSVFSESEIVSLLRNMKAAIALLLEEGADDEVVVLACSMEEDIGIFRWRDQEGCFNVVQTEIFNTILSFIKEGITKSQYNRVKQPISPEQKLCLTLRFMAAGENCHSLAFQFRICVIKDILRSISSKMLHFVIPPPNQDAIKHASIRFHRKWNYPYCCGSIDGKHVRIIRPERSGSLFYNYKELFSVVLLALVDDHYKFLVIDVGSYDKECDTGIFIKSALGKSISDGTFNFPDPAALPGTDTVMTS